MSEHTHLYLILAFTVLTELLIQLQIYFSAYHVLENDLGFYY